MLGEQREVLTLIARGNAKTSPASLVALHHMLCTERARGLLRRHVSAAGADRVRGSAGFARRLACPNIVHRHLEPRWCEARTSPCALRVAREIPGQLGNPFRLDRADPQDSPRWSAKRRRGLIATLPDKRALTLNPARLAWRDADVLAPT
jgi:hypothetical protein